MAARGITKQKYNDNDERTSATNINYSLKKTYVFTIHICMYVFQ